MIEILVDHSSTENYTYLSDISVNIKDPIEKERIERIIEQSNLIGNLEYPDRDFQKSVAELLDVDGGLISVDINEIDLFSE
jgi:hypothetical protein